MWVGGAWDSLAPPPPAPLPPPLSLDPPPPTPPTPPRAAGVARWIFLALWGHLGSRGTKAATQYVTKVFDRVVIQPRDAREASDVFYKQARGWGGGGGMGGRASAG